MTATNASPTMPENVIQFQPGIALCELIERFRSLSTAVSEQSVCFLSVSSLRVERAPCVDQDG